MQRVFSARKSPFETTQWSRLIRAGSGDCRDALAELCQVYWRPVYCFIRARGFGPEKAKDLTQGAFEVLLAPKALAKVDPARGRFRDWLRCVVMSSICNDLDRERTWKRGGRATHVVIGVDVDEEFLQPASGAAVAVNPEAIFNRTWARTVIALAVSRVRKDYRTEGKEALFTRLEGLLLDEDDETTDAELADALGKTVGAIKAERHRLKREARERFRRYLREEIGETVEGPHAIEDELRILLDALA